MSHQLPAGCVMTRTSPGGDYKVWRGGTWLGNVRKLATRRWVAVPVGWTTLLDPVRQLGAPVFPTCTAAARHLVLTLRPERERPLP